MEKKFSVFIILCALIVACGNDTVESLQSLKNSEIAQVMEKADQDAYEPPDSGVLTEDQVEMYVAVKKREAELAKGEAEKLNKTINKAEESEEGSFSGMVKGLDAAQQVAGFMLLDIRAAQELNYNTAEYEWVKNTLMEAHSNSMIGDMGKMQATINQGMEASIAQMEKLRDEIKDAETRSMLDQQIQDSRQQMEQMKQDAAEQQAMSESASVNLALYNKHKDEINLIQNEMAKFSQFNQ